MDPKLSPVSDEWVPLSGTLRSPAQRKPNDRGKRTVVELAPPPEGGSRQTVHRDGFYRPKDSSAEYLTFWTATSRGWAQIGAFAWNQETRAWEASDRPGPRPM